MSPSLVEFLESKRPNLLITIPPKLILKSKKPLGLSDLICYVWFYGGTNGAVTPSVISGYINILYYSLISDIH